MDPLVLVAPATLLVGVVVREGFRTGSVPQRLGATFVATLVAGGWLTSTPTASEALTPAMLYLGFVAGAAWDWRTRTA